MNLIIDIGNTFCKLAVYNNAQQVYFTKTPHETLLETITSISQKQQITKAIVSNVSGEIFDLDGFKFPVLHLTHKTPLPVSINYKTPHTLGKDRIALACAANNYAKNANALVIDCGSCITYDFIDKHNTYQGGAISPGLKMRARAMHQFTGNLPEVTISENESCTFVGKSTETCLKSGIIFGAVNEINGFIQHYKNQYPDILVFLTGGDTFILEKHIKNRIFANPNLLLEGLNIILDFNK